MKNIPIYKALARTVNALKNCEEAGNKEWEELWEDRIEEIMKQYAPTGSGFDGETHLDVTKSTNKKLIFYTSYHFLNENGYYDGWEEYMISVKPILDYDFEIKIFGKNRDDIHDYIGDVFSDFLTEEIPQFSKKELTA